MKRIGYDWAVGRGVQWLWWQRWPRVGHSAHVWPLLMCWHYFGLNFPMMWRWVRSLTVQTLLSLQSPCIQCSVDHSVSHLYNGCDGYVKRRQLISKWNRAIKIVALLLTLLTLSIDWWDDCVINCTLFVPIYAILNENSISFSINVILFGFCEQKIES